MPAYNTESFIGSAIESILAQTYPHFELLVYDDCSTDNTAAIAAAYNDPRIAVIKKIKRTGYTISLVEGIKIARGKYIARMDSDDISLPTRFAKQVSFLELNSGYGIVGGSVQTIADNHPGQIWEYPADNEDIRAFVLVDSPFAHPTVMIRKSVLDEHQLTYCPEYEPCEDFKLWLELMKVTKGKNLSEVVLYYRLHSNQTIAKRRQLLIAQANRVRKEALGLFFNIQLAPEDADVHYYYFNEIGANNAKTISRKYHWRKTLLKQLGGNSGFSKAQEAVEKYWVRNLFTLTEYKFSFLKFLFDRTVVRSFSTKQQLAFFLKCLLNYKVAR